MSQNDHKMPKIAVNLETRFKNALKLLKNSRKVRDLPEQKVAKCGLYCFKVPFVITAKYRKLATLPKSCQRFSKNAKNFLPAQPD